MLNEKALKYIDWAKLNHAYGSAYDVPFQICGLASPDKEIRKGVLSNLYSNIFHQGTRYEATSYAVPFFYQLLLSSNTPERHKIVHLLIDLALGDIEDYLPNGLNILYFRERLNDHSLNCYNAVQNGISILIQLLDDQDVLLRTSIAYALSWFPENANKSLPAVEEQLTKVSNVTEIANLIFAVGLLNDELNYSNLEPFLSHNSRLVRVITAITLARDFFSNEIIDILAEAISHLEELAKVYQHFYYYFLSTEYYAYMIFSRVGILNIDENTLEFSEEFEIVSFLKKHLDKHQKYQNTNQLTFNF